MNTEETREDKMMSINVLLTMSECTKGGQIFVDNSNVTIVTIGSAWGLERRVEDPCEVERARCC